jgi:hypothetical protein
MQQSTRSSDKHLLRKLRNDPILLLRHPTRHIPPRQLKSHSLRLSSLDMHPLEPAQHDFWIVRPAERDVALRHLVAVNITRVGHLHTHAVDVFPQTLVAAVGARGGRVVEFGTVASAFGNERVVAVASCAVGFVQAGAIEPGVDEQRDARDALGESVGGGAAVVDGAVGGRWAR